MGAALPGGFRHIAGADELDDVAGRTRTYRRRRHRRFAILGANERF